MNGERPLRVLFLTRYPVDGASSRYRVFQYVPHLERLGVQCTVQSFMDSVMYRMTLQSGHTLKKVWATTKAVLARLDALSKWRNYDVIYMQRELFPFGPPVVERFLKKRGAVILFDYDDALFIKKPSRYNPIATLLRSPEKTRDMFKIADCTVAGNNWLRDNALAEGGKAVTFEVAEDTTRYHEQAEVNRDQPITIGWLGSPTTVKYLKLIQDPLQKLASRYPDVRWEIIGGNEFTMDGVPWVNTAWSLEGEVAGLARFDIGLMPLPQDEWSNGKSGGKARTYMAAGVVPVCAAIGYNLELIRHGETGFLCKEGEDWYRVLSALIEEEAQRKRVSESAKADVEARFAPEKQAREMVDLFYDVLEAKGATHK